MKKSVYILFIVFVSCAGLKNTGNNSEPVVTTAINIQVGGSYGGFVDNTETDAVSGATSMQYSLGIHPEIWIKNHVIETGLEYVNFNQTLTYNDNEIFGERTYNYGQLHIPLTYNFKIVKNGIGNHPLFYIKLGINYGLQLYTSEESSTSYLPEYSFKRSSFGPYLGISTAPLIINYKWYTGFYCNFFRGTKVYEDTYNKSNDYGNMSYLNFGILLRYKDDKSLH